MWPADTQAQDAQLDSLTPKQRPLYLSFPGCPGDEGSGGRYQISKPCSYTFDLAHNSVEADVTFLPV